MTYKELIYPGKYKQSVLCSFLKRYLYYTTYVNFIVFLSEFYDKENSNMQIESQIVNQMFCVTDRQIIFPYASSDVLLFQAMFNTSYEHFTLFQSEFFLS